MGVFALAELLERQGFASRITHLQLETALESGFDAIAHMARTGSRLCLLDLHWHYQAAPVINFAEALKRQIPDALVVAGGFTASAFAGEILRSHPCIDVVVRGDAEIPLSRLVASVVHRHGAGDFESIPNLSYRRGTEIVTNPQDYVADSGILNTLCFTKFELLRNHRHYLKLKLNQDYQDAFDCPDSQPVFYYNCGRGCPVNCTFCGGGADAQVRLCGRRRPVFIDVASVLRDLGRLASYGISTWHTCFDPDPTGDYYADLFERMHRQGLRLDVVFECWALPTPEFMHSFQRCLGSDSRLVLSPESGSETVRKQNKGFPYTNAQLLAVLDEATRLRIQTELYFAAGLPYETPCDVAVTEELMAALRVKYPACALRVFPLAMEPASPMFENPGRFHVRTERRTFADFLSASSQPDDIGYETNDFDRDAVVQAVVRLRQHESDG
jgi:radical SAM superfamily enzyme YgiQ (UPF0313 family)